MAKKKIDPIIRKESFGERLVKLRKAQGLTQEELAKIIGVTQRVITYYERETPFPPTEILPALAEALQTTSDYLLGIDRKNGTSEKIISPVKNRRLIKSLQALEKLPKEDQKAVVNYIDALSTKRKVMV